MPNYNRTAHTTHTGSTGSSVSDDGDIVTLGPKDTIYITPAGSYVVIYIIHRNKHEEPTKMRTQKTRPKQKTRTKLKKEN